MYKNTVCPDRGAVLFYAMIMIVHILSATFTYKSDARSSYYIVA